MTHAKIILPFKANLFTGKVSRHCLLGLDGRMVITGNVLIRGSPFTILDYYTTTYNTSVINSNHRQCLQLMFVFYNLRPIYKIDSMASPRNKLTLIGLKCTFTTHNHGQYNQGRLM